MLQKFSISVKCCCSDLSFYSSENPEKCNASLFPQKYCAAQLFLTLIIIKKKILSSKSEYYYDFWRSCDAEDLITEDLITEINYILTDIHMEKLF